MLSVFQFEIGRFAQWPSWQAFFFWPPLSLLCLFTVLMASVVGLLAIWAGLGRGHWFLRAAVVLGCISLLLTIPAFELVIVYSLQAGLTIIALAAWRNRRLARRTAAANGPTPDAGRRLPWQFSILDMLLLMTLAAWLSAMLSRAPAAVWANWPLLLAEGVVTAEITIAATWIGLSDWRWWMRLPPMVVLFPATFITVWLWLWRGAHRPSADSRWAFYDALGCRVMLAVATLLILAPVVGAYWRLAHPHTFAEPTRPSPNGYDELVRAGDLIKGVNRPYIETATRAQLKNYVAQCGAVYAPVRAALDKPCEVPLRVNVNGVLEMTHKLQLLRDIAEALWAQGRLAAMEGRKEDAIRSYTDAIRLGRTAMKNGLIIDMLFGITFENIGRSGIAQMRSLLSAEDCLSLLPKLSDLLDESAWSADLPVRDAAWADNAWGWQWRLTNLIDKLVTDDDVPIRNAERACNRVLAQSRLLECELAIRAYSLQHGRAPAALGDLAPGICPKCRKTPLTAAISSTV